MKLLAISYALPPMLYPQAIQIGRLLSHSALDITAVSAGHREDAGSFGRSVKHSVVPFDNEPKGFLNSVALRLVPFYGAMPDPFRAWTNAAHRVINEMIAKDEQPDLLVTFGEPMSDHLLGLRLKKELGVRWLAHFSDPWSDNPFRNIQPLSKMANRFLERRVIEHADAIVFTSQETLDLVCRKYEASVRARATVLPHAFDPQAYPKRGVNDSSNPIILRFIGNFYGHRTPRPLIEALAWLSHNHPDALRDVRVELVGGVPSRMQPRGRKSLPPGLLVLRGSVSYAESLELMTTSDILLTIDAPARESVFFPSKLVDYIGTGKRLVGLVPPGAAARIIAQCNGVSIPPDASAQDIATLLRDEIAAVRAEKERGTRRPLHPSSAAYEIACVAPMFDAMCRAVASGGGHGMAAR